jgi:hypothetical protein
LIPLHPPRGADPAAQAILRADPLRTKRPIHPNELHDHLQIRKGRFSLPKNNGATPDLLPPNLHHDSPFCLGGQNHNSNRERPNRPGEVVVASQEHSPKNFQHSRRVNSLPEPRVLPLDTFLPQQLGGRETCLPGGQRAPFQALGKTDAVQCTAKFRRYHTMGRDRVSGYGPDHRFPVNYFFFLGYLVKIAKILFLARKKVFVSDDAGVIG